MKLVYIFFFSNIDQKWVFLNERSSDLNFLASGASIEERYEVGDEIGRGAFSVVKNGRDKRTNEKVAIKFIEKKFVDKQDLVLLAREIDIMKKVHHPNVKKKKKKTFV